MCKSVKIASKDMKNVNKYTYAILEKMHISHTYLPIISQRILKAISDVDNVENLRIELDDFLF